MKLLLALLLSAVALAGSGEKPTVRVAELRGTIDPATEDFLRVSIQQAEAEGASALIVQLDTPGGLVSSVKEMAQAIDQSKVPVVVYVGPAGAAATSAGALLSLASHVAAMAPGTHIGAAHPVDSGGGDIKGAMGEKALNDTAAFARGLAEVRGRNLELAEEIVKKSRSLTAKEALENKLVEVLADDLGFLLKKLNGRSVSLGKGGGTRVLETEDAIVRISEMSLGQKLLHLLANPNIAAILMSLGMLCLYVEITTPGVIIPGIAGAICIIVSLISFQALPIRTGGLALMSLGLLLLAAEIFVTSQGALAIGGSLSFVMGLLWLIDPLQSSETLSLAVVVPISLALVGGSLGLAWAASRTRVLARDARARMGGGSLGGLEGYLGEVQLAEASPGGGSQGKALIRGEVWNFESPELLAAGDRVRVEALVTPLRLKIIKENS